MFLSTPIWLLDGYPPKIDGKCDGVTKTWIMMIQMINPGYLKIDGRVDPATPSMSPARPNTILLLNMGMAGLLELKDLLTGVPPMLQQALQRVRP